MALLAVAYAKSMTVWTMNTLCDKVIALAAPGRGLHVYITDACVPNSRGWRWGVGRGVSRNSPIQRLGWYFSCPCIPVETYLRLIAIHTNSVLQGTYRQLTCFRLETAASQQASMLKLDRHAFHCSATANIKAALQWKYCTKRGLCADCARLLIHTCKYNKNK